MEKYLDMIAREKASFEEVVQHSLAIFVEKFKYFVRKVRMTCTLSNVNTYVCTYVLESVQLYKSDCINVLCVEIHHSMM